MADQGGKQKVPFKYIDHYEKDAEYFDYFELPTDGATLHEHRRLHEMILRAIPGSAASVLDVGCGGAWLAQALSDSDLTVVSFDAAHKNTTTAIKRFPSEKHFAATGDANHLPFADDSFDTIVSAEVIEHVPIVSIYLDSLLRVLKPGSRLILTTPYNETIQYSLCIHCNRQTPLHAHLRSFNEKTLERYVSGRGDITCTPTTFSNKALLLLRMHTLLKFFPHKFWLGIDKIANKVVAKPIRLMYILDKSYRPINET